MFTLKFQAQQLMATPVEGQDFNAGPRFLFSPLLLDGGEAVAPPTLSPRR